MGIDARRCPRASKMRYQPTPTHSVAERRHSYATSTSQKEDRRIYETRLSSYLYVFLYNTSSTGV